MEHIFYFLYLSFSPDTNALEPAETHFEMNSEQPVALFITISKRCKDY